MAETTGLRERKKARTRQLLADTAARLFAERGYDEVSMADVGRAADVSDQTVYNYFPAKQDLVLDMAEELRDRYTRAVLERPAGTSPASALLEAARELVEVHRTSDPATARGQLPALSAASPSIHRHALEFWDRQTASFTDAVRRTAPGLPAVLARTHAAALVSVFQAIEERTGRSVLDHEDPAAVAAELDRDVATAMDDLDRWFRATTAADGSAR